MYLDVTPKNTNPITRPYILQDSKPKTASPHLLCRRSRRSFRNFPHNRRKRGINHISFSICPPFCRHPAPAAVALNSPTPRSFVEPRPRVIRRSVVRRLSPKLLDRTRSNFPACLCAYSRLIRGRNLKRREEVNVEFQGKLRRVCKLASWAYNRFNRFIILRVRDKGITGPV